MTRLLWLIAGCLLSACSVRPLRFTCSTAQQCGANGECIDSACAFPAPDCPSGFRFDESAENGKAGECTGEVQTDLPSPDLGDSDLAIDGGVLPDLIEADLVSLPDLLPVRILSLVSGKLGGSGNLDGVGTQAGVDSPGALVFDGADAIYIADTNNHQIRKLTISTMTVQNVAGFGGLAGSTDGIGEAARFNLPAGITLAGDSLFVTDTENHTIRRIVLTTREVTTLAGSAGMSGTNDGAGGAARFKNPRGIVADGTSTLYVCDTGNATLRKVTIATKAVEIYAGAAGMSGSTNATGTAARFTKPQAITSDTLGNLFVADGNHTIRKITKLTAATETLAGTAGMAGFTNDTGTAARFENPTSLAADSAGNLFVTDTGNVIVRQIVVATGVVTTFAGAADMIGTTDGALGASRLAVPGGIALGAPGELFIADGSTIRRASGGQLNVVVGAFQNRTAADGSASAARFNSTGPAAVDSSGTLFIADSTDKKIRRVDLTTGAVATTTFMFDRQPVGIAVDDNYVYVADPINYVVTKISKTGTDQSDLAGEAGSFGYAEGTGTEARFKSPRAMTLAGTWLYVSDNNMVRRVAIGTGATELIAGSAGMSGSLDGVGAAARFNFVGGLVADGDDTLFVSDTSNHTIRKITISTKNVETIAGTALMRGYDDGTGAAALFDSPLGLALQGGVLFIADSENGAIRTLDIATNNVTTDVGIKRLFRVKLGPLPTTLNRPVLVLHHAGRMLIGDDGESSILAVE